MRQRFGPYLLLKTLGQGAMGDAHLALPLAPYAHLPSPLVIKRLHGNLNDQAHYLRRFQHEANIATRISSPHVPRVYDVGRVDQIFYIAMELIRGWSLARVIEDLSGTDHRPSLNSAIEIVTDTLQGLSALHSARDEDGAPLAVVHRDVSPKNLIVGEDGLTRVIDLGLGKSARQDWKTRTGAVMGTPGYMAPEQVLAKGVDHRSDLYAVGVILWELLTGTVYIDRGKVPAMLMASVSPKFRAPSTIADLPPMFDELVRRALAHSPGDRFQSAAEFLSAIQEVMPESKEREPISSLIGQILWKELADNTTENRKLVDAARAEPIEQPSEGETMVIARNDRATQIPETIPPSTEIDTQLPPTKMVAPRRPSVVAPRRSIARPLAYAGGLVVVLALGIWIGGQRPTAPAIAPPPPPPPVTIERPVVAPIAEVEAPPPPARKRAPAKISVKSTSREIVPPLPPPPPPIDEYARTPEESAPKWARRLFQLAVDRRRALREGSPQRKAIERIIAALNSAQIAPDSDRLMRDVAKLAKELEALE